MDTSGTNVKDIKNTSQPATNTPTNASKEEPLDKKSSVESTKLSKTNNSEPMDTSETVKKESGVKAFVNEAAGEYYLILYYI